MNDILKKLGINEKNYGANFSNWWSNTESEGLIESYCPNDGQLLGSVFQCSVDDYEKVIQESQKAFVDWRMVPAPERGQMIRKVANKLRENKDLLGSLVSLEMGKIKSEGDGEVQEMIDIADFAVGLSRQLYGLTMHSERPLHRMYEQWHPLGTVGIVTAFNFPA